MHIRKGHRHAAVTLVPPLKVRIDLFVTLSREWPLFALTGRLEST
jgi:hypothetical protein